MHVTTSDEKEAMNLKDGKEGLEEGKEIEAITLL